MTTITMNAFDATHGGTPARTKSAGFADLRAALPDMPASDGALAIVTGVAAGLALAAVPFAVLSWMFIAG